MQAGPRELAAHHMFPSKLLFLLRSLSHLTLPVFQNVNVTLFEGSPKRMLLSPQRWLLREVQGDEGSLQ